MNPYLPLQKRTKPRKTSNNNKAATLQGIQKVWSRARIGGMQTKTSNIQCSVVIPFYRAGYIGWVPFESLIRQEGIDFDWELIVIEEAFHNPFGYTRMIQYWDELKKAGCCRFKYISLQDWMPLAAKWYYLINSIDPNSNVVCFNSSDIYMSHSRLARQFKILSGGQYNWYKLGGNIVYDIASDTHVRLVSIDPKRGDTCCRAATAELLSSLKLDSRKKGVDGWMWKGVKDGAKPYYDDGPIWKDTINITGLNNLSHGRGSRVQNITPPFRPCCGSLNNHMPTEIAQRLLACRKFLESHRRIIRSTRI